MKLNKTLLTTAILASSLVLTACNEKKAETKAPEKAKTEQVAKQDKTKATTSVTKITPTTKALYAASFKVTPSNINIGKTENKIPFIQYNYIIENVGNTPIAAAQWATPVLFNKKVIDIDLFQTEFKDGLAPKAKKTAYFRRALNIYPQTVLEEIQKGSKVDLFPIAGTIIFADGSSVSINSPEALTKLVVEQQKFLTKQLEERNKTNAKKVVKETKTKAEVKQEETKTKK